MLLARKRVACSSGYYGYVMGESESRRRTFVDVNAILPRDAMCACRGRMLAVLVVLLGHLFQLVLALAVFGILVLFSFPWHPVLPHALELPQDAFGVCAARLDVLEDDGLDLVAHGEQLGARRYRGAASTALEYIFQGDIALFEVGAEGFVEV